MGRTQPVHSCELAKLVRSGENNCIALRSSAQRHHDNEKNAKPNEK